MALVIEVVVVEAAENVCHQASEAAQAPRADDLGTNFSQEAFNQVKPRGEGWRQVGSGQIAGSSI
jgi:hypothetical protein